MKSLAPVIVFAYKRTDKLEKCIEALEKNDKHEDTELFIFADGSGGDKDKDDVEAVRKYLNEYKMGSTFKRVQVVFRDRHFGLAENVINGVTEIIEKYGKVIVVEDDLIATEDFIEYINAALNYYENNDNIWSVTGYTEELKSLIRYRHDIYYGYRGCSYGWGTWKDRWKTVDWDMKDYPFLIKSRILQARVNRSGNSMMGMINDQMKGKIDSWAIRWCYAQSKQNKFTVYPSRSFIKDIGTDGSGTHVGKREIQYNRPHLYGDKIELKSLKPDFFITLEYWYKHSDTLWKKLKRNHYLKGIKRLFT